MVCYTSLQFGLQRVALLSPQEMRVLTFRHMIFYLFFSLQEFYLGQLKKHRLRRINLQVSASKILATATAVASDPPLPIVVTSPVFDIP